MANWFVFPMLCICPHLYLLSSILGPKSPGLIILEHELSDQSVQAFISAYPEIKANGWRTMSQAEIPGDSVYQNEDDDYERLV